MSRRAFVLSKDADTIHRIGIFDWKGRAMDTAKDMFKVYSRTSTIDLVHNRNRKYNQLLRLDGLDGYFVIKERERLEHMIKQIDAVIAARALQIPLL